MKTTLHTLAANLKHGALSRTDAQIGGGVFSPDEQLELAHKIEYWRLLLSQATTYLKDIEDPVWRPAEFIEDIEKELS